MRCFPDAREVQLAQRQHPRSIELRGLDGKRKRNEGGGKDAIVVLVPMSGTVS
jgi:hypothetical protein